jgi:DNA modification methylase
VTVSIRVGHVLSELAKLPDESVHCVVTSPPYYGLRSYGTEPQVWGGDPGCAHDFESETITSEIGKGNWAQGTNGRGELQPGGVDAKREPVRTTAERGFCRHCGAWRGDLGLEPTLDLYLDHMLEIMREVRRVMRKDAACFLNIGDSYAGSWGAQSREHAGKHADNPSALSANQIKHHPQRGSHTGSIRAAGLKPKDLMLIPWRLAIRLQEDGWWVRSAICWAKKAPMPESCTDRPTSAWEPVFLLTKAAKYFYDAEAVKEAADVKNFRDSASARRDVPPGALTDSGFANGRHYTSRNLRNVWTLGPEPFSDAHFATFPTEIPRICIKAGTSEKGVCPKCCAPWCRVTARAKQPQSYDAVKYDQADPMFCTKRNMGARYQAEADANPIETVGWQPSCGCNAGDPVPATVLDPFGGAGTTGLVSEQLQRNSILIELNPAYAEMAQRRIRDDASLFYSEAAQ